jgi:glycosyltransferase involved in cell wall biosynthesis
MDGSRSISDISGPPRCVRVVGLARLEAARPAVARNPPPGYGVVAVRCGIASFPPFLEANPYRKLLYERLGERGFRLVPTPRLRLSWLWTERRTVGFLHFHWPEGYWRHDRGASSLRRPLSYVRMCLFLWRLVTARALGYRIVWTIHQVYPHEPGNRQLDRRGAFLLARISHLRVAHDPATAEAARRELRIGPGSVEIVPHGSYIGVYPPGRSRHEVRAGLRIGQEEFVFLCLGNLRPYKQLGLLLTAFLATSPRPAVLVVAGEVSAVQEGERVLSAASDDPRVRPLLGRLDEDRVTELFEASDVAVLPRSDGGTSGALILALSMGVPVIAARTPLSEELTRGGRAGWLFEPANGGSLRAALEDAAASDPKFLLAKGAVGLDQARMLSWAEIGDRMAELLRRL